MIMMWLGFWMFDALGGDGNSWWSFPFCQTFVLLIGIEFFVYRFVIRKVRHPVGNSRGCGK